MSVIESMRRRMMLADEHDVPRQSFLESEMRDGELLVASESPIIRRIGKEHTLAALTLAQGTGRVTSAFTDIYDIDDREPR